MRFSGRTALVTGAGSGLGRDTALSFAREGAAIILIDIDEAANEATRAQIEAAGGRAIAFRANVNDPTQIEGAITKGAAHFSGLHIAINNAGVEQHPAPFAETPIEEYDRVVGVNLRGVWLCMRTELKIMGAQGAGSIVNVGSVADTLGIAGNPLYVAAKHGVLGLTRSAAIEFSKSGVRVNAVSPAGMRTAMYEEMERTHPEIIEMGLNMHPIGRIADLQEVTRAILFLASDEASFILGQTLRVDGGFTVP